MTRGARLFFSIRIDFSSKDKKDEFANSFSISGPLFSAEANLNKASKQFSRDAKITVTAYQVGGDVSKVTALFPSTPVGKTGFVQCQLGDLQTCADVIRDALGYATNVATGFPSQLEPGAKPGGAPLEFRTALYSAAGLFLNGYPYLDLVNRQARTRLQAIFETEFRHSILVDRLLDLGPGPERFTALTAQRKLVDTNMGNILDASKTCYEDAHGCAPAVNALVVANVDEAALQLPPSPTAEYRLLSTSKGLWDRPSSIAIMMSTRRVVGITGQPEDRRVNLAEVEPSGSTSVVLLVHGTSLTTADLFFENRFLRSIVLGGSDSSFAEKFGTGWAALVVDTTRANPGWLDVFIWGEREALMTKDMPVADGVFYFLVRDAFGRASRFDIEYEKWKLETQGKVTVRTIETRNRWWDPSSAGTSASGEGPWTNQSQMRSGTF